METDYLKKCVIKQLYKHKVVIKSSMKNAHDRTATICVSGYLQCVLSGKWRSTVCAKRGSSLYHEP